MKWKEIEKYPVPFYDWVILGKYIEEDDTITWQIGRHLENRPFEFWCKNYSGPWQGDSFKIWNPTEATHWIEIRELNEK
jgi:hypothetical protein